METMGDSKIGKQVPISVLEKIPYVAYMVLHIYASMHACTVYLDTMMPLKKLSLVSLFAT